MSLFIISISKSRTRGLFPVKSKKVVQDKSGTHAFSDRVGQYGMTFIICISKSRTRGLFPVKSKKVVQDKNGRVVSIMVSHLLYASRRVGLVAFSLSSLKK